MAIEIGMNCIHCDVTPARHGSHYCSWACQLEWLKTHAGPVQCDCGAERAYVSEARQRGWDRIVVSDRGYAGRCTACRPKRRKQKLLF